MYNYKINGIKNQYSIHAVYYDYKFFDDYKHSKDGADNSICKKKSQYGVVFGHGKNNGLFMVIYSIFCYNEWNNMKKLYDLLFINCKYS